MLVLINKNNHLHLPWPIVLVVGVLHFCFFVISLSLNAICVLDGSFLENVDSYFLQKKSTHIKRYEITDAIMNSPKSIHIYLVFRQ